MLNFLYFQNQQFKYAPLDAPLFLTLQYLTAMINQLYSKVQDVLIFYNGYFIYSSLPHKVAVQFKEHYYGSGTAWQINDQKIETKFLNFEECAFLRFSNFKGSIITPQKVYIK